MLYCFRERELILNINELIAGFRMFPSYIRIGGLREDLPRGFHDAVRELLQRMPGKLGEYEDLLTGNPIFVKRTQGVGTFNLEQCCQYGLVGPMARAAGSTYDVRKAFPYSSYDTFDFDIPTFTEGDVFDRYRMRIARDAREHQASARRRSIGSRRPATSRSTTRASCRRRRTRSTRRWKR